MYRHASTCLKGPVSRSRPWWQDETGEDTGTVVCLEHHRSEASGNDIRWDVVAQARKAIAAGAYDEPEILERAVAQMLRRLERV